MGERARKRAGVCVRKVESTNARQSWTERWNDPEEGNEGQDVNLNVTKARKKNVVLCQGRNCFEYCDNSKQMWIRQRRSRGAVLNTNRRKSLLGLVSARQR